jgi:FkbM family methyltransferase
MTHPIANISASTGQLNILFNLVDALIGKADVRNVFEFGSRYGEDTIEFAGNYPAASIYAFECNPKSLAILKEKIASCPNIVFNENAISDKSEVIEFYQIDEEKTKTTWADGNQGASSIFKASGNYKVEEYHQKRIQVNAITLKDFLTNNGIPSIDVMWMDIQGAELKALQGLQEKLACLKIVHLEVEFFEIYEGQPLFKDIDGFFKRNGFHLLGFTSRTNYSGDAVYVNKVHFTDAQIAQAAALIPEVHKTLRSRSSSIYFKLKYAALRLKKNLS